jgi:hypothetical protein
VRETLRALGWYFGIVSAPEAERRHLEREDAGERGAWWREALGLGAGAVVVDVVRIEGGDAVLRHHAVPVALFLAATFVLVVCVRSRRGERPPVD